MTEAIVKAILVCIAQTAYVIGVVWLISKWCTTPKKKYEYLLLVANDTEDLQRELERLYDVEWRIVSVHPSSDGSWKIILEHVITQRK